jgi:hypothetical protein
VIYFFVDGGRHGNGCRVGISHLAVCDSVDYVIGDYNNCWVMAIKFPSDHDKKHNNVDWFSYKLPEMDIRCCVGCINRNVVWTHTPAK